MQACGKKMARLVLAAFVSTGGVFFSTKNHAEAVTVDQVTTQDASYTGDGGSDLTINGQDGGMGSWTAIDATENITVGVNTAGNAPNGKLITITGAIQDNGKTVNLGLGEGSTWYMKGDAGTYPFSSVNNLYLDGGIIDAATYCE